MDTQDIINELASCSSPKDRPNEMAYSYYAYAGLVADHIQRLEARITELEEKLTSKTPVSDSLEASLDKIEAEQHQLQLMQSTDTHLSIDDLERIAKVIK